MTEDGDDEPEVTSEDNEPPHVYDEAETVEVVEVTEETVEITEEVVEVTEEVVE